MKSYLVLGLGHFGRSFAATLLEMGHEVMGVDKNMKIVQEFSEFMTHVMQADVANEDFLKSLNVNSFDAVVVDLGDLIETSIMTTVILKELGAKFVLATAQEELQAKVLYKIGTDRVVLPKRDMGIKAARNMVANSFLDMIEISSDYSIIGIKAPRFWIGKTLGELCVRTRYGVNIIAVKSGENINVTPDAGTRIEENSVITVVGSNTSLKKLQDED